jgi:hypothetical protein
MQLRNNFDVCTFLSHSSDSSRLVVRCVGMLNEVRLDMLSGDKFAMCSNHYCMVLGDLSGGVHDTISCSGAVLSFGDGPENMYNPLGMSDLLVGGMNALPQSVLGIVVNSLDYYYLSDVRLQFSSAVVGINCSDDFETCVHLGDSSSLCFGNTEHDFIISSSSAFVLGVNVALVFGGVFYFVMRNRIRAEEKKTLLWLFSVPIIALAMLARGVFRVNIYAYIFGNCLALLLFPTIVFIFEDAHRAVFPESTYTKT